MHDEIGGECEGDNRSATQNEHEASGSRESPGESLLEHSNKHAILTIVLSVIGAMLTRPDNVQHAPPSQQPIRPLPAIANIYGSDLSAAAQCTNTDTNEDEDEELAVEFSRAGDDEPSDDAPQESTTNSNATTGSSPRSGKPSWLPSAYASLRERLTTEMKRSTTHMPSCYERCSFYEGTESPFLTARSQFQLDAGVFHQAAWFIWLPHLLVDRIPCPGCIKAGRKSSSGSAVYLQKHGFTDSPRRVVDVDRNIYLVGYRYLCGHGNCKRAYQSWNPDILDVLPPALSREFQFRLTYRSGLSHRLAVLLREAFRSGVGPDQFTTMIECFHYHRFDQLQVQFLEMVSDRMRGSLSQYWSTTNGFGEFRDLNGYAGFVPSASYFGHFYDMLVEESTPEIQQLISSLPAEILKQDHSFKVCIVSAFSRPNLISV